STGERGDVARCRELGVSAYLTKPIKQSDLLDAIVTVLHTSSTTEPHEPLLRFQTFLPEARQRLHILLAEDNTINQRVTIGILEKQGHSVVVVGNGKEALAALEKEAFDILLMDVQMPEMDGFEATKVIRARERSLSVSQPFSPVGAKLEDSRMKSSRPSHLPI